MHTVTSRWVLALACLVLGACSNLDVSDLNNVSVRLALVTGSSAGVTAGAVSAASRDPDPGPMIADRRALATDLARGDGPWVNDLAAWLALPQGLVPQLGKTLREARPVLAEALAEPLSESAFRTLLGVTLCRDEALRFHAWRRFDCAKLAPKS